MSNAPPIILDDAIKQLAEKGSYADFRAGVAHLMDDMRTRKAVLSLVRALPRNFRNWQKTESVRLHVELNGAEVTVPNVLAAEVKRLDSRIDTHEFKAVNGLKIEYEDGVLEKMLAGMKPDGRGYTDVHEIFMEKIGQPARNHVLREQSRITGLRKKYDDVRVTVREGTDGQPEFRAFSVTQDGIDAQARQAQDARARAIAEITDIARYISAVTAPDVDGKLRSAIKVQLRYVQDPPVLAWQKREVFAMLGKRETPDPASLNVPARIHAALAQGNANMQTQFNDAVKQVPITPSPQVMKELTDAVLNTETGEGMPVRKLVSEYFVTPMVQWMKQNLADVIAQTKEFSDTVVVVDALGAPRRIATAHTHSAFGVWAKTGLKTQAPVKAPRTASFKKSVAQKFI